MVLEVGYVGNYAQRLYQGRPEPGSVHTLWEVDLCQAFSNVANALKKRRPTQRFQTSPFLEALGAVAGFACGTSCTQKFIAPCVSAGVPAGCFGDGTGGFVNSNLLDCWEGLPIPNSGGADNTQVLDSYVIGSHGHSNYNAGFLSLRKQTSSGLTFNFNYTFSHAFDQLGQNQERARKLRRHLNRPRLRLGPV